MMAVFPAGFDPFARLKEIGERMRRGTLAQRVDAGDALKRLQQQLAAQQQVMRLGVSVDDLRCHMDAAFGKPVNAPEEPTDRDGLRAMLDRAILPPRGASHIEGDQ